MQQQIYGVIPEYILSVQPLVERICRIQQRSCIQKLFEIERKKPYRMIVVDRGEVVIDERRIQGIGIRRCGQQHENNGRAHGVILAGD